MNGVDFWRTVMGHRLIDGTLPKLVAELGRLNDNLERLLTLVAREPQPKGRPEDHQESR